MPVTSTHRRPRRRPVSPCLHDVLTALEYARGPLLPRDLARRVGASVPDVREALRQLVSIGRASNVPGKGWAHKPAPLRVAPDSAPMTDRKRREHRRQQALAAIRHTPDGLSAWGLAQRLHVQPSVVGVLLRDLIAAGKVERVIVPDGVVYRLRGVM